jgi:hypothetical protein
MYIPSRHCSPTKMQVHRAQVLFFNCNDRFVLGYRAQFQLRLKLKRLAKEKEKSPKARPRQKHATWKKCIVMQQQFLQVVFEDKDCFKKGGVL